MLLPAAVLGQTGKYIQVGDNGDSLQDSFWLFELQSTHAIGFAELLPTYKFEIYGAWSPTSSPGEIAFGNHSSAVTTGTVLGRLLFLSRDTSAGAEGLVAAIEAVASGEHSTTYHRTDLVFKTSNEVEDFGIENMRLHYDGNLTIGTSTHYNYKLFVNGEFRANGIRTESASVPNVIGGAAGNSFTSGNYGVVIGGGGAGSGYEHTVNGNYAAIGGGYSNDLVGSYSVVAGGYSNSLDSVAAVISGGYSNVIATGSSYAVISGGISNEIGSNSDYSFIGGGQDNYLYSDLNYEVIGGGRENGMTAQGTSSYNVIGGGYSNYMTGSFGNVIAGGIDNYTFGSYSVIPGGYQNSTLDNYTFAAGYRAEADEEGSFVWSSYNGGSGTCSSDAENQFKVCAVGGAWFSNNVSAASFTDRTPYPYDLETAYSAVLSMRRLPDGQYNPDDMGSQLDHESLHPFVTSVEADGTKSRNLSATVSAQNEVIKSLIERVTVLELEVTAIKAKVR